MKQYVSELGKLYQAKQTNSKLDDIVATIRNYLEFEIVSGQKLPITTSVECVRGLSTNDLWYVTVGLCEHGCVGDFLFEKKPNGKIEYVLEDLY